MNNNLFASVAVSPASAGLPTPHSEVSVELVNLREVFALDQSVIVKVHGDCMNTRIQHGNYVIVNTALIPETGDIVAYDVGDNEFLVKTYKSGGRGGLRLVPLNSSYDEIHPTDGRFVGVVTWIFSSTGKTGCRVA